MMSPKQEWDIPRPIKSMITKEVFMLLVDCEFCKSKSVSNGL